MASPCVKKISFNRNHVLLPQILIYVCIEEPLHLLCIPGLSTGLDVFLEPASLFLSEILPELLFWSFILPCTAQYLP